MEKDKIKLTNIKNSIREMFWNGKNTIEEKLIYWHGYLSALDMQGLINVKEFQELYVYLHKQKRLAEERLNS